MSQLEREGAIGIKWAEARDAAQHPAIYGTVPTAQHYLAPDVGGAWVEKLEEEGVPGGMK